MKMENKKNYAAPILCPQPVIITDRCAMAGGVFLFTCHKLPFNRYNRYFETTSCSWEILNISHECYAHECYNNSFSIRLLRRKYSH